MEHKIDEAAVWQRVTGSDAGRQVLLTPELLNVLAQMESCLRLLNQLARSNRSYSAAAQSQRQQTVRLSGLIYLLDGSPPAAQHITPPSGSRAQQLFWLLPTIERCAARLNELTAKAAGLPRETLKELAVQQQALWNQCLNLLGQLTMT